jgi:CRISPR-associated endonuclease/helicase Cas3
MMVLFISRSEKKSIYTVRKILDNFADRIGNDTWRTVITAAGLLTVQTILRRNATKNTAVACHWIRSRNNSELMWIVGNREKFNTEGIVPINTTRKKIIHSEWENQWQYLPLLKTLVAVAALLHDWGKASDLFQYKLKTRTLQADPFRHEWISCKLIEAVITYSNSYENDKKWLQLFVNGTLENHQILEVITSETSHLEQQSLKKMPPVASMIIWLILSHHRLPNVKKDGYDNLKRDTFSSMLKCINSLWGYENENLELTDRRWEQCFLFSKGILLDDTVVWQQKIKKWTTKLLEQYPLVEAILLDGHALRILLNYARLCLMLGDHYASSLSKVTDPQILRKWNVRDLWANTDNHTHEYKQCLEEHLVIVSDQALKIVYQLPRFTNEMEKAYDIRSLRKKSPKQFHWQDNIVDKIKQFRNDQEKDFSYFIVNMASTGCGKTFANAKIMQSVSDDGKSLRYILALGLRSLTLQTGDEYRNRMGLNKNELAILIGSSAIKELHDRENLNTFQDQTSVSGITEELLSENLEYIDTNNSEQVSFLDIFFNSHNRNSKKNNAFLYKPVLVATIDHMMSATETIQGGRYILPFLRLMSSDLVIDEIDDFDKKDLVAIARLVYLAGMLGRNVVISSATIPPDLAEGMYRSFKEGLLCYNHFFSESKRCGVVLCDEFTAKIAVLDINNLQGYQQIHTDFIDKRVYHLIKQQIKRKGYIQPCPCQSEMKSLEEKKISYFSDMQKAAEQLHIYNHIIDKQTGKNVSFGLIRVANIQPCVELSLFLLKCSWKQNYAVRLMTYHSRQILLLRHEQEKYLDTILKRKYDNSVPVNINDKIIRCHLDHIKENNVLFIVVATPVEEVGRDHDFDWAVIEPSSYRSFIQLSGRVLRHRIFDNDIINSNIAIMQYNLRGLRGDKRAFIYPGYETEMHLLDSHDMYNLIDKKNIEKRIDAIPRIKKAPKLYPQSKLIDLEHIVMQEFNSKNDMGPQCMNGWLYEYWWMTALPQKFNRFRESYTADIKIYAIYLDGKIEFCEYMNDEYKPIQKLFEIERYTFFSSEMLKRIWLKRDYMDTLKRMIQEIDNQSMENLMNRNSKKFGEITIPGIAINKKKWFYSDQLGLFENKGGNISG